MAPRMRPRRSYRWLGLMALLPLVLSGCGQQYVVFHPAGPVAASELHLLVLASIAMGIVITVVLILAAIALIRFHDRPAHPGIKNPRWLHARWLEVVLFGVPMIIVAIIAVPTVKTTYALDQLPPGKQPVVVDVTSLDWKWVFEYPAQRIATVNYLKIPTGTPVLFELTADSPMNTFWVPQLGGMEYTMPGEVLPLWLQADHPGVYAGRSAQFSGPGFVHMTFNVDAVSPSAFQAWVNSVKTSAPPMTMATYTTLTKFGTVGPETFSSYPVKGTFPQVTHGFTLNGTMPMPMP
ncbi:cytochrome aa3 quinol oxidase subunit 2 [Sulfobacillus acidophilus DSM 10332]|uniref:Cytochrome aa3 quinol oxidase subunit 2 n=1 Tax=Sulfobacillus acidophilus (strain ATCC 700253 / DSM 10332 / NAL) TaxID=679936 RepID=G8TXK0_SULAD|nr:cytochrome aa3 quinol oxidase subunit 2 [Sulfobacillus acidophilus DSM 10332]